MAATRRDTPRAKGAISNCSGLCDGDAEVDAKGVAVSVTGGGGAHPIFVVSLIVKPGVPGSFLFDNGLCNNVNDLPWQSFAVSSNVPLDLVAKEGCSSSENGDIVGVMDVCVGTSIVGDNVDESLGPPMEKSEAKAIFQEAIKETMPQAGLQADW